MSPLRHQKQLRLSAARNRMLVDGVDAATAAFEVGYESVNQFNGEYSRVFGQPPMRDIRNLLASDIRPASQMGMHFVGVLVLDLANPLSGAV